MLCYIAFSGSLSLSSYSTSYSTSYTSSPVYFLLSKEIKSSALYFSVTCLALP
ncbi:Uncharacterized protein APZ42_018654 [Daphnia magna]|uniref:Uncharacterized protein n=1 Tax=Daphnia magna TaxID=35525 RepID=A0A164YPB7_9CRUS|nr:Uncharacterized protein APZ42_018654 [Daphnia magna]